MPSQIKDLGSSHASRLLGSVGQFAHSGSASLARFGIVGRSEAFQSHLSRSSVLDRNEEELASAAEASVTEEAHEEADSAAEAQSEDEQGADSGQTEEVGDEDARSDAPDAAAGESGAGSGSETEGAAHACDASKAGAEACAQGNPGAHAPDQAAARSVTAFNETLLSQSQWALNKLLGRQANGRQGQAEVRGADGGNSAARGRRGQANAAQSADALEAQTAVSQRSGQDERTSAGGIADRGSKTFTGSVPDTNGDHGVKTAQTDQKPGSRGGVEAHASQAAAGPRTGSGAKADGNTHADPRLTSVRVEALKEFATGAKSGAGSEASRGTVAIGGTAAKIDPGAQRAAQVPASRPGAALAQHAEHAEGAQTASLRAQALRGMVSAISRGESSLTIRLDPQELGSLSVEVDVKDGVVDARFESASREARRLLDASLPGLRRELEARGLEVRRLEVAEAQPPEDADGPARHTLRDEQTRQPFQDALGDDPRRGDSRGQTGTDARARTRGSGVPNDAGAVEPAESNTAPLSHAEALGETLGEGWWIDAVV